MHIMTGNMYEFECKDVTAPHKIIYDIMNITCSILCLKIFLDTGIKWCDVCFYKQIINISSVVNVQINFKFLSLCSI